MFRLFNGGVNARSGRHVPDDLRRTRHSGPEPAEPWGLAESWTEDPDGIRIVLVEFPPATLSAVTRDRRHRPGDDRYAACAGVHGGL
jgi:hypothetical protein